MSDAPVCERTFVLRSELGLHARPAGRFAAAAARFEARISVGLGEEWVDGRSILSLLSLAAAQGSELTVRAEGSDAAEAVEILGRLVEGEGSEEEAAESV